MIKQKKILYQKEIEANIFACYLLMPDPDFEVDVEHFLNGEIREDELLKHLVVKYKVPRTAVIYRLGMMGIII
jgi:Zn-dependent peptidase ImmA (M78 family)